MTTALLHPATDAEILATFDVMHHLRPRPHPRDLCRADPGVDGLGRLSARGRLELISNVVRERAHAFYFREELAVDASG